ncbi:MAG TPA: protein kinase [Kofleriaceae bacterium]|nr:protein kinase [Kofleriaceae bacterium]
MEANFPIAFGRYKLVERLAVGGMAELFLADVVGDHGFAKRVVIKRILPQLAADPHFTQMFIAEAKITARLSHPKIAQTHRLGHEDGQLFIEMEYVDGLDVLAMLRECAHRRVRLPAEVSVYIMKEVLDGLDFAHRVCDDGGRPLHIVHRDISPSNVLVSRRGNVKLVDFGIAQAATEQQTKAGTLKGKYGYMSPEQVMGTGVSALSDLFSVGVVLAEMLMGRRLFAAPNELDVLLMVRDVNLGRLERFGAHVAGDLDLLLRRALTKEPHERFASAAEMREALDDWLYHSRLRINPGRVGELVESLFDDAHQRRRASLDELGVPSARPPIHVGPSLAPPLTAAGEAAPTAEGTEPRRAPSVLEHEIEGIPSGRSLVLGGSDALSEEEIELAAPRRDDSRARTARLDLSGRAPSTQPGPSAFSGERDEDDLVLNEEVDIEIDLSGIEAGKSGSAPNISVPGEKDPGWQKIARRWGERAASRRPGTTPTGEYLPDAVPSLPRDTEDGIPISISLDDGGPGVRFPSIGAAVASVSPERRDPSARDFDGTGVPGLMAEDIRSGSVRLPSMAEIAMAPRPAPPSLDEINETPAQQGDLSKITPIRMLFQLISARADGLLVVAVGGIRKEIYLRRGVPTYVSSNMASELFGAYLVGEGAVSSGELDMALAMMPHFGGKLGDTLVGLGLMKPLDVFRMLTRQVRHKLVDVCTWSKGAYTWYPGRENQRESFPIDVDPYEVLGAGALALRDDYLWKWSETVHAMRPRAVDRPPVRPEQLKIGRLGREVLLMLDGRTPVSDLIARRPGPDERLQLLRVLFLFLETGLALDAAG